MRSTHLAPCTHTYFCKVEKHAHGAKLYKYATTPLYIASRHLLLLAHPCSAYPAHRQTCTYTHADLALGPHMLYHRVALTAPIGAGQQGPSCLLSSLPKSMPQSQTHAHINATTLGKNNNRCSPSDHRAPGIRPEQRLLARVTDPSHEQAHAVRPICIYNVYIYTIYIYVLV